MASTMGEKYTSGAYNPRAALPVSAGLLCSTTHRANFRSKLPRIVLSCWNVFASRRRHNTTHRLEYYSWKIPHRPEPRRWTPSRSPPAAAPRSAAPSAAPRPPPPPRLPPRSGKPEIKWGRRVARGRNVSLEAFDVCVVCTEKERRKGREGQETRIEDKIT